MAVPDNLGVVVVPGCSRPRESPTWPPPTPPENFEIPDPLATILLLTLDCTNTLDARTMPKDTSKPGKAPNNKKAAAKPAKPINKANKAPVASKPAQPSQDGGAKVSAAPEAAIVHSPGFGPTLIS